MARRYHGRGQWDRMKRDPNIQRAIGFLLGLGVQASQIAREKGRQTWNRPCETPAPPKNAPQPPLPQLYSSTGGKTAVSIVKIVSGAILSSLTFLLTIAALILLFTGEGLLACLMSLALLASSVGLTASGISGVSRIGRFKQYCRALGAKTHCSLEQLARAVGKPEPYVRKDLKKMIQQGLFLEGHMDLEETTLITSHDTYRHFEESRLQFERQKELEAREKAQQKAREEAARAEEQEKQAGESDPKVQAVLAQGEAFLEQIHRCNDAIPGQEISDKISRMELIVQKIFHRVEADPEVVDDLKKMMDYYLPMTVKLLQAYADMDAQPIQGQTIAASKQEIETTIDTLNQAFEKLLDSIFQETAMDVSSDISVLQTLLAQEGLTEDPLSQARKEAGKN